MKAQLRFLVSLLFVLALLSPFGAQASKTSPTPGGKPAPVNQIPLAIQSTANSLTGSLEAQGFQVKGGYFKLFSKEDCDSAYKVMGTCYGNNPAAPYVMPVVPYWPDEFQDPADKDAFGPTADGYTAGYRLDPREAILIMGMLPPKSAYLGLQSYVGTREGYWDVSSDTYKWIAGNAVSLFSTFFTRQPGNLARIQIASSLSNSINNVVIERQAGSSFGQVRYFITTPDKFMDRVIRDSLEQDGVPASAIFTQPIPGTMRLGVGVSADLFSTLIRYAVPDDGGTSGTASDAWRKQLPLVALRIRDPHVERPAEPYPDVKLEDRIVNYDETVLANSVDNLVWAISNKWKQPCATPNCRSTTGPAWQFSNWQVPPINAIGPECTKIGMNCNGDTLDTTYQVSNRVSLDNGEIYAVVGALGTATGNATYTGLGLNASRKQNGFDNISDTSLDPNLRGTAAVFASGAITSTDKLFVYYFARSCAGLDAYINTNDANEPNCREISEDEFAGCPDPASDTCDYLVISQRDYIVPGTQRGPDATKTLSPRLLQLHRPAGASQIRLYLPVLWK
jgi:hypothetical protein